MKFKLLCVITGLFVSCFSCSTMPVKKHPDYKGVDKRAVQIVNEYLDLAKANGITFSNKVTVGYTAIEQEDVVGICNYGDKWREIDVDQSYWAGTSDARKHTLLFHELTHCYCTRDHDWGDGKKKYPQKAADRVKEALEWQKKGGDRPGYWDDGCPTSLMYPDVVDELCYWYHKDEYLKEMFNRCVPW